MPLTDKHEQNPLKGGLPIWRGAPSVERACALMQAKLELAGVSWHTDAYTVYNGGMFESMHLHIKLKYLRPRPQKKGITYDIYCS